jgi:branched-chain amino acid transport system permease protein
MNSSSRLALPEALKDALIAALVALALAAPILGLKTDTGVGQGLVLVQRWSAVAIAVGVVFFGRLALRLLWWNRRAGAPLAPSAMRQRFAEMTIGKGKYIAPLFAAAALILPLMPFADRYIVDLSTLVLTYVMLGWGLNIVVGLAGLLDLGYVAFYAVGAYSFALLAIHFDLSFWMALPIAGMLAACWGIALGFPVLRLRGDYLAIVTLAFGEIIRIVLLNWYQFTGGPDGLSGIPRPSFFGLPFTPLEEGPAFHRFFGIDFNPMHRIIFLYYVILLLALITNAVTIRLRRLPVGRAWEALREDEIACKSLGINVRNTKLTAFAMGAMFGGIAGCFFATRQGFISPESFVFLESATVLAIVVLGGLGSQLGIAFAALVMIGFFEVFREINEFRMLAFGLSMVLIMVWRPRGLVGSRKPTISLGQTAQAISPELVGQGKG